MWQSALLVAVLVSAMPVMAQFGTRRANDLSPDRLLSAQLEVFARTALLGEGEPSDDQLTRARILLDLALEYDPQHAELWRLRSELATFESDTSTAERALRTYLNLHPEDDQAQLQLILTLIGREQTMDGRLQSMERILTSSRGNQLSRPLRSRLALYAAVAARELGDQQNFGRWLSQAVQLDAANPEAAQLTYEFAVMRGADMRQLGVAAIARVRAMPLSLPARLDLGQILLNEAAYFQAAEQFDTMMYLVETVPDEARLREWVLSLAAANRNSDALRMLGNYESYLRGQRDPEHVPDNGEVDPILPLELELLRLVIVESVHDELHRELGDVSYMNVKKGLADREEAGEEKAPLDYAWVSALFNRELDEVELTIRQNDPSDPLVKRARGWLAIHKRDPEAARQPFADISNTDPFAKLGMAELLDPTDDNHRMALQSIVYDNPASLAGLLAARRLTLSRRDVRPTQTGALLISQMSRFPNRLWRAQIQGIPWVGLRIDVEPKRFSYLQQIPATVTLTNHSGVSLSLGSQGTLPTTVMLNFTPSIDARRTSSLPPMVLDLHRRITLGAGESVTVPLRLDATVFGGIARSHPHGNVGLRVGGLLDPVAMPDGRVNPGLLGMRDTLQGVNIPGQNPTAELIDQWIELLSEDDGSRRMLALAQLMQLPGSGIEPLSDVVRSRKLNDTINSLYPNLPAEQQAWAVSFLTSQALRANAFGRVMEVAQRSTEPLVQIMLLTTQVDDPESPMLTAALRSNDSKIREYAAAVQATLRRESASAN